jgi:FkbM family methyltransferase
MNYKKICKEICPPFIWGLLIYFLNKNTSYKGLNGIDRKLERYINFDNGYFVELGANDGVTQSNTYHFQHTRGWTGILVEPTPHKYLQCRENRSKNAKVFCNACTSFEYKNKFVEIYYSNLMSTPVGVESDIKNPNEHLESGKRFLSKFEDNFIYGAIAKPLQYILKSAGAPRIMDLLSLDVEGAEIEVLKGVDHSSYRFRFMLIESRSRDKLESYLKVYDYNLIDQLSEHDYLFKDVKH